MENKRYTNQLSTCCVVAIVCTGCSLANKTYSKYKILARVNSGELILNNNQQSRLHGMINSGANNGGFVASTKVIGSDILVVVERANARKNRIG